MKHLHPVKSDSDSDSKIKLNPTELLETDPNSAQAIGLRNKISSMKNPKIVDKKIFRTTEIARIFTAILLIGVGMIIEYFFPESKIVGDWSTGGCIIASGAGILAMVFILFFASKALDLYERYILINNQKSKGHLHES